MTEDIQSLLFDIIEPHTLQYAVLSSPRNKKQELQKVVIRPVQIKEELRYQITQIRKQQSFHNNVDPPECLRLIKAFLEQDFKQALLCTNDADYHVLANKKGLFTALKRKPTHCETLQEHNRPKQYLLDESTPIPFLVELGVMAAEGRIIAKKTDKFKQLNRFLEMVKDIIPHLDKSRTLHIVDFGCGKAYLTFALYHYLVNMLDYDVKIHGLDLKEDVILFCQKLANKLQYDGLEFSLGDIKNFSPSDKVDMVIALHACDTATDYAIAQAIKWQADVIMCVPCCQKELFKQVQCPSLLPLLKHGILKERFAALATDAARAQLLDIAGYNTQVLEFIDLEHTPKNLLIRAVRQPEKKKKDPLKAIEEYREFKEKLAIHPCLEKLIP